MEYRSLGKTGLNVSVAGLGCGGNSRLGLGRGASFDDCVAVVRTAVDLGVNFLDTAEAYGTEEIVGAATRSYDRDRLVISTKAIFRGADETGETVAHKVGSNNGSHQLSSSRYVYAVRPDSSAPFTRSASSRERFAAAIFCVYFRRISFAS